MKYGLILEEPVIYIVNAFGLVIASICIFYFYKFSEDRVKTEKLILSSFIGTCLVLVYVRVFYSSNVVTVTDVLGLLASFCSICMFGSPLLSISKVMQSKSVTGHIIFPVALLSLIVCILWTSIGFAFHDTFILIPNFIGALLASAQVLVYIKFKNVKMIHVLPTKVNMEERED